MKILIIDDEMAALTKMKVLLKPYGDCVLCTNAGQALQICKDSIKNRGYFDLITIDIYLGSVNGNDLLHQINQLELREVVPSAKKIMITASGTKDNLMKAYNQGCDGFLVKPVKQDAMEQKMASLGYQKLVATAK